MLCDILYKYILYSICLMSGMDIELDEGHCKMPTYLQVPNILTRVNH